MAASSAIVLWVVRENPVGLLRPCPLRTLTGIPCFACGTTEAMRDLFAGRIAAGARSNPLAVALAAAALSSGIVAIAVMPWAARLHPRTPSRRAIYWIVGTLLIANWAYLIIASRR